MPYRGRAEADSSARLLLFALLAAASLVGWVTCCVVGPNRDVTLAWLPWPLANMARALHAYRVLAWDEAGLVDALRRISGMQMVAHPAAVSAILAPHAYHWWQRAARNISERGAAAPGRCPEATA